MIDASTKALVLDESCLPIIVTQLNDDVTADDVQFLLTRLDELERAGAPHVLFFDLRGLAVPWTPDAQLSVREHERGRNGSRSSRIAIGLVTRSQRTMAGIASHYAAVPPDAKQRVFTDLDECLSWLCSALVKAGAIEKRDLPKLVARVEQKLAPQSFGELPKTVVTKERIAQIALVMDAYREAAYLIDDDNNILYATVEARRRPTPEWLESCLANSTPAAPPPYRLQSLSEGLYHVAPAYGVPVGLDQRIYIELPHSLHEIADLMARGLSDKQIAAETGRPIATVRTYSKRVLTRLELKSRTELALLWPRIIDRESSPL